MSLALAPFEHDGHKVNVIDTPGYADFVSDVAAALRAADLAVFVVSAVEGVEVQTEIVWRMADELGLPRAIFVNKLDRERASFSRTLDELKDKFGAGVAPLQLPIGDEADFHGVVELLDDHAVHYVDGKATEGPIPPEMEMEEHSIHDALIEGIVVGDDDLMERYLADETIPTAELAHALADGRRVGRGVPGAVRQRDQADRRRPARVVHRRGGPRAHARRRATAHRSRSCSRRSSTRTSAT